MSSIQSFANIYAVSQLRWGAAGIAGVSITWCRAALQSNPINLCDYKKLVLTTFDGANSNIYFDLE